jgi:hypothetical protein
MKNSLKITGFMLILLLLGSMSINAQVGGRRGGMYGSMGYVTPPLTTEQQTKITTMADKYRVEMDTLRSQLRRSTDIKKRGDLASKIQILSDTHKSDVTNVLTPEQKISLETVNNIFNGKSGAGMMMSDTLRMRPLHENTMGSGMMMMPNAMGKGNMNNNFYGGRKNNRFGNMNRRR